MRYIRIKNEYGLYIILDENDNYYACYSKHFGSFEIHKDDPNIIVEESLEELCDEFVCGEHLLKPKFTKFDGEGYTTETYHQGIINAFKSGVNYKDYCWYGAIWTDKGLIYVAKMNDKGELELI